MGATSSRVTWLVFRDAGCMIAIGAVVGMVLAALSGRVVAAFLFGDPARPVTFVSVPVVILLTAIIAAAAPAWRASRIDPSRRFATRGERFAIRSSRT